MNSWTPRIVPCPVEERREALALLYRRVPASLRSHLIENAVTEAERGEVDLSGLWVAWRGSRRVGALLTQPLAGRAAAVWPPEVEASWGRSVIALALVRHALDWLRGSGCLLAQSLLDESASRQAALDLAAGGMPQVTELLYLEGETSLEVPLRPETPALDWRSFGPETETEVRAVLHQTYVGSLDMPELEGLRSLDDVLSGHRAAGRFVPDRWRIGRIPGEPDAAALVLLSELPDRDAWEVAYLGLTPPARGRGLGRAALAHAIDLARPHVQRIELAVDLRNHPAHHLYRAVGLRPFDRRAVHLVAFD